MDIEITKFEPDSKNDGELFMSEDKDGRWIQIEDYLALQDRLRAAEYKAELYDEVWATAKSMNLENVTSGLSELKKLRAIVDEAQGQGCIPWLDVNDHKPESGRRLFVTDGEKIEAGYGYAIHGGAIGNLNGSPLDRVKEIKRWIYEDDFPKSLLSALPPIPVKQVPDVLLDGELREKYELIIKNQSSWIKSDLDRKIIKLVMKSNSSGDGLMDLYPALLLGRQLLQSHPEPKQSGLDKETISTALDFIRCGIYGNYSPEYAEEQMELYHKPIAQYFESLKQSVDGEPEKVFGPKDADKIINNLVFTMNPDSDLQSVEISGGGDYSFGEDNDGWYVEKDDCQIFWALSEEYAKKIVGLLNCSDSQPSPNKADVQHWNPIETAPKDGTEILLCSAVAHDIGLCYWREDNVMTGWTWGMEQRFDHAKWWMPLPDTKMLPPLPLPPLKDE